MAKKFILKNGKFTLNNGSFCKSDPANVYTITPTLTNVTADASNPSVITEGTTATLKFTANLGYDLPSSVSVVGAIGTWTKSTGTLVLTNPTSNVTFSISGVEPDRNYLCITSTYNYSQQLRFNAVGSGWTVPNLQYSLNSKTNWKNYTFGTSITIPKKQKIYFRGNNERFSNSYTQYIQIDCDAGGNWSVSGNVMSLLDITCLQTSVPSFAFAHLFEELDGTITKDFILPATVLSEGCYMYMFNGVTGISDQLQLPALNMEKDCYVGLFSNSGLQNPISLPSINLAEGCYASMFNGCMNLRRIPDLPATNITKDCYFAMFSGCSQLSVNIMTETPYVFHIPSTGPCTNVQSQDQQYMFDGTSGELQGGLTFDNGDQHTLYYD